MTDNVEDIFPLSFAQQAWLVRMIQAGDRDPGLVHNVCVLRGLLKVRVFREAWNHTIDRHPALRTSFHWEGLNSPVQVVHREAKVEIREDDLSRLGGQARAAKLADLLRQHVDAGLDPGRAPVMALLLIRTGSAEHTLSWKSHHLLIDGWSAAAVWRDVMTTYEELVDGSTVDSTRGPAFKRYVLWEREQDLSAAEAYWSERFGDTSGADGGGHDGDPANVSAVQTVRLTKQQSADIRGAARAHRLTLNTLLQAGWALALARLKGSDVVSFGATVSGRPAEVSGVESMIGLFSNALPVRLNVRRNGRISEWLREIQQAHIDSLPYHYAPLSMIQRWIGLPSTERFFDSLLIAENYPSQAGDGEGGPGIEVVEFDGGIASVYPLNAVAMPGLEIELQLHYDPLQFDDEQAEALLAAWRVAISSSALQPETAVATVLEGLPEVVPAPGAQRPEQADVADAAAEPARSLPPAETPASSGDENLLVARIAAIWRDQLGIDRAEAHDNFFDIGGRSLDAVQVLERMNNELDVRVDLTDLIFQTLGQVAARAAKERLKNK